MQAPRGTSNVWPHVLPQSEPGASCPDLSSHLTEPHNIRHNVSRPMEPPAPRFPSLSLPIPSILDSGSDKQRRQLPGLHELLSPGAQGETTAPGRYANHTTNTQSRPNPPDSHNPLSISASSWSQVQPIASAFGRSSYGSAAVEHTPEHVRRDQEPPHGMPPPPPLTASTMHSFTRQGGPPLHLVTPLDFRSSLSRPAMGFSDLGNPDLRRDSVRSNSFAAGTAECVGQRTIPGKGLCYVYKDGNTCPTVIDGEVVNPMWGTTKAGKARKRLAQACL